MMILFRRDARQMSRQRPAYLARGALKRCVWVLAALLLAGCGSASVALPPATPTPTTVAGPAPGRPAPSGSPEPVTTPLAAAPGNCALTRPPQTKHLDHLGGNEDVDLAGGGPFWIYGFYYQSVLHLEQSAWPATKMVVEVGPNYDQPVTLRLQEQRTGALAWWTDGQTPPGAATQTLTLDPQTDLEDVGSVPGVPDIPHGSPDPGWSEWGLFPLFSVAGCYTLEVSWAGGSWQSVLAVGS